MRFVRLSLVVEHDVGFALGVCSLEKKIEGGLVLVVGGDIIWKCGCV